MLGNAFLSFDNPLLSRQGKLYRAFWSGAIPALTTYHFIIYIPVGKVAYGILRDNAIFDGNVNVSFNVGGTYTTTDETKTAYNFDEVGGPAATCSLRRISGLTGQSQRTSEFMSSPTTGPTRSVSAQTSVGAHPKFDSTRFPIFSYQNLDNDTTSLWLNLIWEEQNA